MSRIKRKIESKKKRRQLRILLFFIFIFMIMGILSVDFALREMLALEEIKVLGYEFQQDHVVFYVIGSKMYIEKERIEEIQVKIEGRYDSLKEQLNYLIERIKKVGINRLFFKYNIE